MCRFTFENQGVNTFLVYTIEDDSPLDTPSLGMLTNNKIKGLVPMYYAQMDNTKYFKYNITSKISLQQYFQGEITKKQLLKVFYSITETLLLIEEYMIPFETILFDMDKVYIKVQNASAELICLPLLNTSTGVDVRDFFKNIFFDIQFESGDYAAQIINYLNKKDAFSLVEFKTLLNRLMDEKPSQGLNEKIPAVNRGPQEARQEQKKEINKQSAADSGVHIQWKQEAVNQSSVKDMHQAVYFDTAEAKNKKKSHFWEFGKNKKKEENQVQKNVNNVYLRNMNIPGKAVEFDNKPQVPKKTPQEKIAVQNVQPYSNNAAGPMVQKVQEQKKGNKAGAFGDTVFMNGGEETEETLMQDETPAKENNPYLLRKNNNEKIPIDKANFRLGRNIDSNDYNIDNGYVSHSHCHIITRNGEYFIMDDNSKGHTYVDEKMVQPGSEVKLMHGQCIRLANEKFEFYIF